MRSNTSLLSGILGGGIVIALFIVIMLTMNLFNYRITVNKIHIINATSVDSIQTLEIDTLIVNQELIKQELIQQLNKEKIILTPQEYTNNVVSYYNNLLLVLSVMLAAFSVLSFVYLKSWSKDLIQETLESDEFHEDVSERLLGKAESNFREDISQLQKEIKALENRLVECCEKENDDNNDSEIE